MSNTAAYVALLLSSVRSMELSPFLEEVEELQAVKESIKVAKIIDKMIFLLFIYLFI